jgi:catechol 2,3-dioxygenase-like lactoylglutathione lyase family enzyme
MHTSAPAGASHGRLTDPMPQSLSSVTFLVRDYDEAIAYFTHALGFEVIEDSPRGDGKRWVLVRPPGLDGASLLLAKAATPEQEAHVGRQAGGRVAFFLHTDDFRRDHRAMQERGVRFKEEPREEEYGTVAVFTDLYGNRWDLLQLRDATPPAEPATALADLLSHRS